MYWKQKSRHKWLKDGDGYTMFFHASAKAEVAKCHISCLVDGDASLTEVAKIETHVNLF